MLITSTLTSPYVRPTGPPAAVESGAGSGPASIAAAPRDIQPPAPSAPSAPNPFPALASFAAGSQTGDTATGMTRSSGAPGSHAASPSGSPHADPSRAARSNSAADLAPADASETRAEADEITVEGDADTQRFTAVAAQNWMTTDLLIKSIVAPAEQSHTKSVAAETILGAAVSAYMANSRDAEQVRADHAA
ncbi:hypothetical protein DFR52_106156 [Hoeflea marina]|uniref:Uncharacterized protein n=1 Tax=Hoeflea marina TaxID=274592 RepID=A0A317PHX4_9HYPH|nr:hypothetical protein [Hoeflea marina]PWV97633.1 hypothetical protein DFR52_106156 [Hoeflea marina]